MAGQKKNDGWWIEKKWMVGWMDKKIDKKQMDG